MCTHVEHREEHITQLSVLELFADDLLYKEMENPHHLL